VPPSFTSNIDTMAKGHHHHHEREHHGHHLIPIPVLLKVFGALVALTFITIVTAKFVNLGPLNLPLALLLAATKTTLVVMFFMALKYDNRVNTLVFSLGVVFVLVFLVFTLFDTEFRGDLGNVGSETISDIEYREEQLRAREPSPDALRTTPGVPAQGTTAQEAAGDEEPADVADDAADADE
jgi:cytochrome c oxidase subunit IV